MSIVIELNYCEFNPSKLLGFKLFLLCFAVFRGVHATVKC